jgi:hypothetical protein
MSKNQSDKREIVRLNDVPQSRTPDPAPKRARNSRSTSKRSNGIPAERVTPGRAAPTDTALSHAAPADAASRLLIAVEPSVNRSSALISVSDAITRLQQEQIRLQKERDLWKRRYQEEGEAREKQTG